MACYQPCHSRESSTGTERVTVRGLVSSIPKHPGRRCSGGRNCCEGRGCARMDTHGLTLQWLAPLIFPVHKHEEEARLTRALARGDWGGHSMDRGTSRPCRPEPWRTGRWPRVQTSMHASRPLRGKPTAPSLSQHPLPAAHAPSTSPPAAQAHGHTLPRRTAPLPGLAHYNPTSCPDVNPFPHPSPDDPNTPS